jgi:hypothetical protein
MGSGERWFPLPLSLLITWMVTVTTSIERWNELQSKAQQHNIIDAFRSFRENDIEPILIKGWAAARKYPPGVLRRPGDVDLAVSPDQYERARELLLGPELKKCNIDLHNGLRRLDSVPWNDLFEHSYMVELDGDLIRVLSDEDHLRLLCTHWLVDGGGYKDKLWDIYYAVENRSADFDWERCLDAAGPVRRGWVVCGIMAAHHFLGLDIADLPMRDNERNLPKWVTRTIEREWKMSYRLEPVLTSTHDNRLLLSQITRRIPPNPIRCTIEAEGDIYGNKRFLYQLSTMSRRAKPFVKDLISYFRLRRSGKIQ